MKKNRALLALQTHNAKCQPTFHSYTTLIIERYWWNFQFFCPPMVNNSRQKLLYIAALPLDLTDNLRQEPTYFKREKMIKIGLLFKISDRNLEGLLFDFEKYFYWEWNKYRTRRESTICIMWKFISKKLCFKPMVRIIITWRKFASSNNCFSLIWKFFI